MTQTVTALFDHYVGAENAVRALGATGVPHDAIAIVANNSDGAVIKHDLAIEEDAGKGAGLGALIGGTGGLLASLGLLVVPGVGPAVAAGWLASMAFGAVAGGTIGAAAGGLVGALTNAGIPQSHALVLAEGVRRGGALVTARIADDHVAAASAILGAQGSAVDVDRRGDAYRKEGWVGFDEGAPVYTSDQIAAERDGHLFV